MIESHPAILGDSPPLPLLPLSISLVSLLLLPSRITPFLVDLVSCSASHRLTPLSSSLSLSSTWSSGTEIVGGTFKMLEFFQQELLIEQQSLLKVVPSFSSLLSSFSDGPRFSFSPPSRHAETEFFDLGTSLFLLTSSSSLLPPRSLSRSSYVVLRLLFLRFLEIPITSKPLEWFISLPPLLLVPIPDYSTPALAISLLLSLSLSCSLIVSHSFRIIAPTDENFCESFPPPPPPAPPAISHSGFFSLSSAHFLQSLDSYQRFLDQIPPMPQLPEPRKRKVSTAGGALVRPLVDVPLASSRSLSERRRGVRGGKLTACRRFPRAAEGADGLRLSS
eukprot:750609-Hanusia_phi.AAC.11